MKKPYEQHHPKKITRKVSEPVGKGQNISQPKQNSGYADEQPIHLDNSVNLKKGIKKVFDK